MSRKVKRGRRGSCNGREFYDPEETAKIGGIEGPQTLLAMR